MRTLHLDPNGNVGQSGIVLMTIGIVLVTIGDPYETLFEMNAVVIWLLFSSTTEDASVRK